MMTLVTSSRRPAVIAWNSALCSQSTGSTVAPVSLARRMNSVPAQTRHSLLASASVAPRSIAASAGSKPGRAGDRADHPVGGAARRLRDRVGSGRGLDAGAGQAPPSVRHRPSGSRDRREARAEFARQLGERRAVLVRGQRLDGEAPGWRLSRSTVLEPIEPVAPRIVTLRTARVRFGAAAVPCRHPSPDQQAAGRPIQAAARAIPTMTAASSRCQKPVEPIHQPAMARDQLARILGAELALDRGFEQVAGLRRDRKHKRHKHQHRGDNKPAQPATTIEARRDRRQVPPTAPDQVFFGLTAGQSFGPPIARPAK